MGFKGYRLWVMGQLDSNMQSPAAGSEHAVVTKSATSSANSSSAAAAAFLPVMSVSRRHAVALQVYI
jgi:hypothetical protein